MTKGVFRISLVRNTSRALGLSLGLSMTVIGGVLVGLASAENWKLALLVFGAGVLFVIYYVKPYWGYLFTVGAAMLTHYRFGTSIGHWRLEQVAGILALVSLWKLRSRGAGLWFDTVTGAGVLWIVINGLASVFAPQVFESEKIVAWLATDLLVLVFTRAIIQRYGMAAAFLPLWVAGLCAIVWGIAFAQLHPGLYGGRAMLPMEEPDVFGTFAAVIAIYSLFIVRPGTVARVPAKYGYVGMGVGIAGLLLSGTRSSLVGFLIAVLVAVVMEQQWRQRLWRSVWIIIGAGVLLLMFVKSSATSRLGRFSSSNNLAYRLVRVRRALSGIVNSWHHLLLGHGTNAYGQFHLTILNGVIVPDYLSAQLFTVPYDTGLIGTVAFIGFVSFVLRRNAVYRRNTLLARASLYALIAMFVAYQATNGIWFGYTWIVLGLALGPLASTDSETL